MRYPGIWLRILAACAVATLAADLSSAQAQTGPAPPGAVGMDNGPVKSNADPVVAVVNTNSIHLSDVGDAIRTMPGGGAGNSFEALYPAVLRGLIAREALLIKARAAGVAEDPAVRRHMQAAADQVLINAYLQRETTKLVTDQTLTERYDAEIQGKPGPEEVHGQVILVKTEAEAQDIIAKLAAGADFATLARQSGNDSIARIGGDIGFVRREGLAPEVAAVLFAPETPQKPEHEGDTDAHRDGEVDVGCEAVHEGTPGPAALQAGGSRVGSPAGQKKRDESRRHPGG